MRNRLIHLTTFALVLPPSLLSAVTAAWDVSDPRRRTGDAAPTSPSLLTQALGFARAFVAMRRQVEPMCPNRDDVVNAAYRAALEVDPYTSIDEDFRLFTDFWMQIHPSLDRHKVDAAEAWRAGQIQRGMWFNAGYEAGLAGKSKELRIVPPEMWDHFETGWVDGVKDREEGQELAGEATAGAVDDEGQADGA